MYLEKEKNKVIWLIVALISLTSVIAANPNIDVIIITPDDSADIGIQVAPNPGAIKEITITTEVTDLDGVGDIKSIKSTTPFGVITLNKISNIDSDTGSYSNSFDVNFYDAPITYQIKVTAEDNNGNKAYDTTSFDYLESINVELDSNTINFLDVNAASDSIVTGDNDMLTVNSPTIQNYGNTIIDAEIYGSDLSSGSNIILVNNVKYTFVDQNWNNELAGILDYSSERKNISLYYGVMETNEASYKLYVPSGTVPGSYSGTVTITAVQGTGNRAPVLHYIEDIIAAEGDLVKITPQATDLDGDGLTYTFTSPLDSNGEWQTQSGDEGVYTVTVTVSDSNLEDSQNVIITILSVCEDADGDSYYAIAPGCPTGDDCDDNNPDVYPGATEVCNGIDDDCDESIDEGGNALCDDYVFCNGQETCQGAEGCQPGILVDCSGEDLNEITTCSNNPDNNPFTWDYFAGFTSACDENADVCTTGTVTLTYTCDKIQCSAECEVDLDCDDSDVHTIDVCQSNCVCEHQFVNNDPTIDSFTPTDTTPEINEGSSLDFSVTASDPDEDSLSYSWRLDDVVVSTGTSHVYEPGYQDSGTHMIKVIVSDGELTASQEWTVAVNNVDVPDLEISNLRLYYPQSPDTTSGTMYAFTIKNIGEIATDNIFWKLNTGEEVIYSDYSFSLEVNEDIFVYTAPYVYTSSGTKPVTAVVDYEDKIIELNEENNEESISVTVS